MSPGTRATPTAPGGCAPRARRRACGAAHSKIAWCCRPRLPGPIQSLWTSACVSWWPCNGSRRRSGGPSRPSAPVTRCAAHGFPRGVAARGGRRGFSQGLRDRPRGGGHPRCTTASPWPPTCGAPREASPAPASRRPGARALQQGRGTEVLPPLRQLPGAARLRRGPGGHGLWLPIVPEEANLRPRFLPLETDDQELPGYARVEDGTTSGYVEIKSIDRNPQRCSTRVSGVICFGRVGVRAAGI